MLYDANGALLKTELDGVKLMNRGKVRDVYDLGDSILFVATDRISAFDFVMPNGIPNKGKVLTQISLFWFELMDWMKNHLISADFDKFPVELQEYRKDLEGRSIIVKKAKPLPIECIVRGYIIGSGWKDYQKTGKICGIQLKDNYKQADKLDEAIFTPSTKAEQGLHDENISFKKTVEIIGKEKADTIKELSLKIYNSAADYARDKGIILADTKFEFGELGGEIILIDEVLTPDSSRFWPADKYEVGCSPPSLDKQFVRDYLEGCGWDKTDPAPELPKDIVLNTSKKYLEAYKALTGKELKQSIKNLRKLTESRFFVVFYCDELLFCRKKYKGTVVPFMVVSLNVGSNGAYRGTIQDVARKNSIILPAVRNEKTGDLIDGDMVCYMKNDYIFMPGDKVKVVLGE